MARLLARGADPRRRFMDGARALDLAAAQGHPGVVEELLTHDPGLLDLPGLDESSALAVASAGDHTEVIRVLLAHGPDARRQLEDGTRALDWAAHEGRLATVEQLLAHDPLLLDLPGHPGRTALAVAAGSGHFAVVNALLSRGADPRTRLADGTRALDWAAAEGHQDVVERLLAHAPHSGTCPEDMSSPP